MSCHGHDDADDLCCHCEQPMPESVMDWVVGWGHMFCSTTCADQWKESAQ